MLEQIIKDIKRLLIEASHNKEKSDATLQYEVIEINLPTERQLTFTPAKEVEYKDIEGFEVVTGERATEIGSMTDEESRDEYNEYLVITFKDGQTATFCNSHVDLFRI